MTAASSSGAASSRLREHLRSLDPDLAALADAMWVKAKPIHDRQSRPGGNVNGRSHCEMVEDNIWQLLSIDSNRLGKDNHVYVSADELYLLTCCACCHDFGKGLKQEGSSDHIKHGAKSAEHLRGNWQALGLESRNKAELAATVIATHDSEDFAADCEALCDIPKPNLRRIATLLKAADILHLDESRVSEVAAPSSTLDGDDLSKQRARSCVLNWRADGSRIIVTALQCDPQELTAIREMAARTEKDWEPLKKLLLDFGFPFELQFNLCLSGSKGGSGLSKPIVVLPLAGVKYSDARDNQPAADRIFSDEPLKIIAIPLDKLEAHLCKFGALSVVGNAYVEPKMDDIDDQVHALNRLFVGPASCGKTRAALEWIEKHIGIDDNAWVVLRPEQGKLPEAISRYEIAWEEHYTGIEKPRKAILFVDDLPDSLPPPDERDSAAEAVRRLLGWFANEAFQERRFVGTIRSELLVGRPGWPRKLLELGGDIHLLRVRQLVREGQMEMWRGMNTAKGCKSDSKGMSGLGLFIGDDFVEAVSKINAEPEAIAYFVRAMVAQGKKALKKEDARSFSNDVCSVWLKETWPAIRMAHGTAASVFYTLARFFEAGARGGSSLRESLPPLWEYHAVIGPRLLEHVGCKGTGYMVTIRQLLVEGHAVGKEGKWIRPTFDFLLQAADLKSLSVELPSVEWFAAAARGLGPAEQSLLSLYFRLLGLSYTGEHASSGWLIGHLVAVHGLLLEPEGNGDTLMLEASQVWEALRQRILQHLEGEEARTLSKGTHVIVDQQREHMKHEAALSACVECLSLLSCSPSSDASEATAIVLLDKGRTLADLARHEEAVACFEGLVCRFAKSDAPATRELVAQALLNKGVVLGTLNRHEEAVACFNDLAKRFGTDDSPAIREQVVMALLYKGITLGELNRHGEAVACYEDLVSRVRGIDSPAIRKIVAMTLRNKGLCFGVLNRLNEALACYSDLLGSFGDDDSPVIREQVASAILCKGVTLRDLNRHEEAIACYDDLVSRFGNDDSPAVTKIVAMALQEKGIALVTLNRHEEAVACYDDLVCRIGNDDSPVMREMVASAILSKGDALGDLKRHDEAVACYQDLTRDFGEDNSPVIREWVAWALLGEGITLHELQRYEDEVTCYEDLAKRFDKNDASVARKVLAPALQNASSTWLLIWRAKGDAKALEKAIATGRASVLHGGSPYTLSCVLAIAKEKEEALHLLEKCLKDNKIKWRKVARDHDWDGMRSEPGYRRLEEKYRPKKKAKKRK